MSRKVTLKIQYKDKSTDTFVVNERDGEKFLMALDNVTANEFILNNISIDPKNIESVWLHVFPVADETILS